jgi:ferredoxin--NADP+ reductase
MDHKIKQIINYGYKNQNIFLQVERNGIEFEPGMCCDIFGRSYSFAGDANNKDNLEFLIKVIDSGQAGEQFRNLKVGNSIEIGEVFGFFNPGKDCKDKEYSYVATGTGIAPFRSALLTYDHSPEYFFFGGKTLEDWFDIVEIISTKHPDTKILSARSAVEDSVFEIMPRYVTEHVRNNLPTYNENYKFYLCGLDRMISDVSNVLIYNDYTYDQIQTEQFYSKL